VCAVTTGTDINIRTAIQQKTPLMLALEHNQLEVVDLLLKRGVMMHLQLKDANGWTALHYAACFARVELSVVRGPPFSASNSTDTASYL
jgi:ankyrin repeat protein